MERLASLSDDALLDELHAIVGSHRRVTADLIQHLGEVDARRLYAEKGCSSLFSYCIELLRFSEDEACRRIEAARLARRFPAIYAPLETGAVSLTVVGLLKPHLTDANHRDLLLGVSGSSVRQAKEWLAARFPQPDVPSTIRKLATHCPVTQPPLAAAAGSKTAPASPTTSACSLESVSLAASGPLTTSAFPATSDPLVTSELPEAPRPLMPSEFPATPDPLMTSELPAAPHSGARIFQAPPAAARVKVEPLSQDRFLVKFTASRTMRDKLELCRDLMRHANPQGDFEVVLERAVDLLVAELQKKRQGRTGRPRTNPRSARDTADGANHPNGGDLRLEDTADGPNHLNGGKVTLRDTADGSNHRKGGEVTHAVRREVVARDGWGCSFVANDGRRCDARGFLEFDHETPKGRGGSSGAKNLRLLCRSHNRLAAERVYGKAFVALAISAEQRKRARTS